MSEPSESPTPSPKPATLRIHDTHLVCAIQTITDGTRVSTCPVCAAHSTLPTSGGWLSVKCPSCGSEFIASDGSPPPPPPPPLPEPLPKTKPAARYSPEAPSFWSLVRRRPFGVLWVLLRSLVTAFLPPPPAPKGSLLDAVMTWLAMCLAGCLVLFTALCLLTGLLGMLADVFRSLFGD